MKIRQKIELISAASLLSMGLVVLAICIQGLRTSIYSQNRTVVSRYMSLVTQFVDEELSRLADIAEAMSNNSDFVQAVKRRDSAALRAISLDARPTV